MWYLKIKLNYFQKITLLVIVNIVVIFFISCKKDTINNPCENKNDAKAEFVIYEALSNTAFTEADTISLNSQVTLRSLSNKDCNIKWNIKSISHNYTYYDTIVNLNPTYFATTLTPNQMYTVTLIVTKNNGTCTDYKLIDSAKKQFYIWGKQWDNDWNGPYNYNPIFGTYAGFKESNPNQLVYVTLFDTVSIIPNLPCNGDAGGKLYNSNTIRNLAYNNFSSENFTKGNGVNFYSYGASLLIFDYNAIQLYNNPNGCYGSKFLILYGGKAWLDINNSNKIYIDYKYKDTISYLWINDKFTGTRIN